MKQTSNLSWRWLVGVAVVLGALLSLSACSQQPDSEPLVNDTRLLSLETSQSYYILGHYLDYYFDPHLERDIPRLTSPEFAAQFQPVEQAVPNFGFASGDYWFRLQVSNPSEEPQTWLMELRNPTALQFDLYWQDVETQIWQKKEIGYIYPFTQREVAYYNYVYALDMAPGETRTLYILATSPLASFPLWLWSPPAFYEQAQVSYLLFGLVLGNLFTLAFAFVLVYSFTRQRYYLYYILFLFSYTVAQASMQGITGQYLWPETPDFNRVAVLMSAGMASVAVLQFAAGFLSAKQKMPRLYKLVQIQTGLLIGYIVLVPVLLFSPQATVGYVTSLGIFLVIFIINSRVLLFSLGFLAWRQGYPPARYYLFSITFDVILTLIIEPVRQGWLTLPYGLGPDSLNQFSIVVVAFGLAIALANQINLLNQQKIQAQQQALTAAREKDQLIRNQNLMLEKQVQERTQELVQANQAKSTFLANMSHELRTPLNGILGYAEILKHRPEQLDQAIKIIQRSGKHLLALIEDLLDLARIEAGRLQLNPSQVDLHDLLRNVSALIDVQANDKNLRYHIYLADNVPLYVHTDGRALRQILLNLLSNAVKFTTAGGIEFRITGQADHWVDFTIRDTGPGIKAEQITRLFEPFERGEQTHIQGVGLGLNISQRMAQLLGGDISVQSELGQGSTFTLSLPLPPIDVDNQADSSELIRGYSGPRQKVLIIDDQTENRQVLRGYLEIIGFDILETESGMEALQLAQEHQPALILCDLLMPDVDGLTLIQTLRQQNFEPDPVIFVVSASAYPHHERLSEQAGADDFISKPVMLDRLQSKLHQHLDLDWQSIDSPAPEPSKAHLPHPPTATALPKADWVELQEAALLGDWHALHQKMDKLRSEPQWAEVLAHLEPLVNSFAIQEVQTYLGINVDDFKDKSS